MKLYTFEIAPNPRRVALFVQYKGIELDVEEVNIRDLDQYSEEFKRLNPNYTVPVLELDDGRTLCDAISICCYLETVYPDKPLMGNDDFERAEIIGWDHNIYIDGLGAVAEVFRNKEKGFKGRALAGPTKLEQLPELVSRGRIRVAGFFKQLDEHLQGRDYIVGSALSLADIDALVVCDFAGWIKESIPADCQALQAWYQRISGELGLP